MTDVLREVGMIARALDSISNIEFRQLNLTKGQYLYLARICENPGIIQEQLGELIMVDRSTVIRAVKRLETTGFIIKKADLTNKKIKHLHPTQTGLEAYQTVIRENNYSTCVALHDFTNQEQEQLERLLTRVRKNVAIDWEFVKKGNHRKY